MQSAYCGSSFSGTDMYMLLIRYLPRFWANVIILVWYLLLAILVILTSGTHQAEFRYGNI